MIRLHVFVEGQTEETFFNGELKHHLAQFGVDANVRQLRRSPGKPARGKGGWTSYDRAKRDIAISMKQEPSAWHTTMVDLYGLPKDFPGRSDMGRYSDPYQRVAYLEKTWIDALSPNTQARFIPYIQLHEFEALIFTDPQKLDWEFLEHDGPIERLVELSQNQAPELIDDGEHTAPSKRIIKEIPQYEGRKASAGPLIAGKTGLQKLRIRCPHFGDWVSKLEKLGSPSTPDDET